MAISGELICLWYSPSIIDVKFSLLFLKFDTRIGDILVRTHKLIIAISFVAVILHLGKAVFFSSMFGNVIGIQMLGISQRMIEILLKLFAILFCYNLDLF
jgi:hypothetical protein